MIKKITKFVLSFSLIVGLQLNTTYASNEVNELVEEIVEHSKPKSKNNKFIAGMVVGTIIGSGSFFYYDQFKAKPKNRNNNEQLNEILENNLVIHVEKFESLEKYIRKSVENILHNLDPNNFLEKFVKNLDVGKLDNLVPDEIRDNAGGALNLVKGILTNGTSVGRSSESEESFSDEDGRSTHIED